MNWFVSNSYFCYFCPDDFVTAQVTFNFDGTNQSENNFILIDDNVCERDEIFAAIFPEDEDINVVEPDVTFIIIKDNDSKCNGYNITQ